MLSIIDDILDFSKIEAGKIELEIRAFSLDQVIQDVVNIISSNIDEQKIDFKLSRDPLTPNWFFGDSKRIEQILLNVLNNARKFTSQGHISLDIGLLKKDGDKHYIAFTVEDTGIGIATEQIDKLFMPFEQGDRTINRRFGGSGLGLSIVKNLLDLMGGEIKVSSKRGEGSSFIISLPLILDQEKEECYRQSFSNSRISKLKVLVLEREESKVSQISRYLSSFGMDYKIVASRESAINCLKLNGKTSRPIDLFIIDYHALNEAHFSFFDSIRNMDEIISIPKLMVLLPIMREDLLYSLDKHGIDMGIVKPIIPSILLRGILDIFNLKDLSAPQVVASDHISLEDSEESHLVLVAEDNETNQLIVKSLLDQLGIESIFANNGREAVDTYRNHKSRIGLILMDLHMPVMNGYEAAENIRDISNKVPIVAMTADLLQDIRDKCKKNGISHQISKPLNPDNFMRIVKNIILSNEYLEDIEILDRQIGLRNMGGDPDLYAQVLKVYYKESKDTLSLLETALTDNKYQQAKEILHKLKSSTGSIGAKPLFDITIALEKAIDEGNHGEILLLKDRFSKLYTKLIDELREILFKSTLGKGE